MIEYLIIAQLKFQSPQIQKTQSVPILSANSALVYDLETQDTLFAKNIDLQLPIASLTKLMTAHIIMTEHELSEVVTIQNIASNTDGSTMNLKSNDKLTEYQLLYFSTFLLF